MSPDTRTVWVPADAPPEESSFRSEVVPGWMVPLLRRRDLETEDEVERFLRPELEHLHDPLRLAGLPEAVRRLQRARDGGEKVAIVGDYDVDGVTGTALLVAVFRAVGLEVLPILPHRMTDGYGFQPVHARRAASEGCGLVVTVDCGTTSHEAIGSAIDAGLDVVVTDHHLPGAPLPDEVLFVNPKQEGCDYPFGELSGAGLAYKLAVAVADACGRDVDPRLLVRVACLGTIADLVPLRGENRVLASVGLRELEKTRNPGIRALFRAAKMSPPYSAQDVGYRVGPRLNAPGRLDSAERSLELLLCRDPARARRLATELDTWNRERQQEERHVVEEADAMVAARAAEGRLPAVLVAWKETWHRGVVGIAAGRLARRWNRPTILLGAADALATGSGRSIEGAHLHRFLESWSSKFERFGGHAQAIGLSVSTERLPELRAEWEAAAEECWRELVSKRTYRYELDLEAGEVTEALLDDLERLEPHGIGNPRPLVRVHGGLRLAGRPRGFGRGHVEAELSSADGARIRVVGWGWSERVGQLRGPCEVLGYLERSYRSPAPALRLLDARPTP